MKRNQTYPPPIANRSQAPLTTTLVALPCRSGAGLSSLESMARKSDSDPTIATMYAAVAIAARAVSPMTTAYLTVSVPCIPAALWASTLQ
jgi:ActR/RegA family two-component response regulator